MNSYEYVPNKFTRSWLTAMALELVSPCRLAKYPTQMEAELMGIHELMQNVEAKALVALEVKVLRTHVHVAIRMAGHTKRIDPDKWRPCVVGM
jgi:flavin reductase (DIM6/NTAB) family NADH-FMN oxidoreductase RutF